MCSPMILQIIIKWCRLSLDLRLLHTTRGSDDMSWSPTIPLAELLRQCVISVPARVVRLEEMNWGHDARIMEDLRNGRSYLCSCMINRDRQTGDGWHGQEARGMNGPRSPKGWMGRLVPQLTMQVVGDGMKVQLLLANT